MFNDLMAYDLLAVSAKAGARSLLDERGRETVHSHVSILWEVSCLFGDPGDLFLEASFPFWEVLEIH